ncbi:MAG: DUF1475 family protein [Acholeplasma sp.]|nr:DUF1475 family protein [Acholeplasma sp.]
MKIAKNIMWLGSLVMFIALINVFINGNLALDGPKIIGNAWGIVSLVDLFLGLILFAIWVMFREKNIAFKLFFMVLLMIFGFLAASIYVLFNLKLSDGDWEKFFLGWRKEKLIKDNN